MLVSVSVLTAAYCFERTKSCQETQWSSGWLKWPTILHERPTAGGKDLWPAPRFV